VTAAGSNVVNREAAPRGIATWLNVNVRLWQAASLLVASIVAAPILVLASTWLVPAGDVWRHLAETVLPG
jgi:iron(III) transport system permease protein